MVSFYISLIDVVVKVYLQSWIDAYRYNFYNVRCRCIE